MLTENIHNTETSEEATTLNCDSDISCVLSPADVTVMTSPLSAVLSLNFDSTEKI